MKKVKHGTFPVTKVFRFKTFQLDWTCHIKRTEYFVFICSRIVETKSTCALHSTKIVVIRQENTDSWLNTREHRLLFTKQLL